MEERHEKHMEEKRKENRNEDLVHEHLMSLIASKQVSVLYADSRKDLRRTDK